MVSRAVAFRHADWLALVEPKGSFLTLPVLNRVFPNGLDRTEAAKRQEVRDRYPGNMAEPAARTAWVEWVLGDLLRWGDRVRTGPQIPPALTVTVPEHGAVLRPDYALAEPDGDRETLRALVCMWPLGTNLDAKPEKAVAKDRWAATPTERAGHLARATGVHLVLVTDGNQWRLVWSPPDTGAAGATFLASIFSEEPALLDAFVSLFGARRFFAVEADNTIEALLVESERAQEEVAQELGRQVRSAAELLVGAIGQANRERDGELLDGVAETEIYQGTVSVLMRLVFLLFAEERGLLPLDDEVYARGYAVSTLRDQLQTERDLHGEEPLERRNSGWFRLLALFRVMHGGLSHDRLRIPPYGGRLFDPDRFPFLEGRKPGDRWRHDPAHPIPVDDLTLLEVLTKLQVLETREGGLWEARQLSYRLLEVEQIGHVYEGLLDHSVQRVHAVTLGVEGAKGGEPEVLLSDLESAAARGRDELLAWLKGETGLSASKLTRLLDKPVEDHDRQLLLVAVENDEALSQRLLPYLHLLRRTPRDVPIVLLAGSIYVTQTSARRDGGVEYTTRELAEEVAQFTLEPLVYSPGPQDGVAPDQWQLLPSAELLDLRICDPAVGSGAILVAAGRFLADRLVEAWVAEGADEALGEDDDVRLAARRAVADRCLYGVDRDPLATEMAKLSLWLTTMAKDRPFTFLDHAIRTGDALLGVTSLDQVRWMHLDAEKGGKLHTTLGDWLGVLEPLVHTALERRRRLVDIRVVDIRDAEEKARLTAEADADLELLRAVGDLVVGAHLSTASQRASAVDSRLLTAAERVGKTLIEPEGDDRRLAVAELRSLAAQWLNELRPDSAPPRLCMHWPLEFPEVFLDRDEIGFDAFVGNPPYNGNKYWKERLGPEFQGYFQTLLGGTIGKPDEIVPFIWRMVSLTSSGGAVGTLSTQSVSEVDSKKLMERCVLNCSEIYRATRSKQWPGNASVVISQLWLRKGSWQGQFILDGNIVSRVGADLRPDNGWPEPRLLAMSLDTFQGVDNSQGMSMVVPADHPLVSLGDERIKPYVSGKNLTLGDPTSPPRYVMDLTGYTEAQVNELPVPLKQFLMTEVRPDRTPDKLTSYRGLETRWWTFWNTREEGYQRARLHDRCIAVGAVAKYLIPLRLPSSWVYTNKAFVFPIAREDVQVLLLSQPFDQWSRVHGGSLGSGRTLKIALVRSFPLPTVTLPDSLASKWQSSLLHAMKTLSTHATGALNAVHDPSMEHPDVAALRTSYSEINRAVFDAYEWRDISSEMLFRETEDGERFALPQDIEGEVLNRLHRLNREQAEAEALTTPSPRTRSGRRQPTPSSDTPSLFDDAADDTGEDE